MLHLDIGNLSTFSVWICVVYFVLCAASESDLCEVENQCFSQWMSMIIGSRFVTAALSDPQWTDYIKEFLKDMPTILSGMALKEVLGVVFAFWLIFKFVEKEKAFGQMRNTTGWNDLGRSWTRLNGCVWWKGDRERDGEKDGESLWPSKLKAWLMVTCTSWWWPVPDPCSFMSQEQCACTVKFRHSGQGDKHLQQSQLGDERLLRTLLLVVVAV